MTKFENSGVEKSEAFVTKPRQDLYADLAVRSGTNGRANKAKLINRSMYGRAKLACTQRHSDSSFSFARSYARFIRLSEEPPNKTGANPANR